MSGNVTVLPLTTPGTLLTLFHVLTPSQTAMYAASLAGTADVSVNVPPIFVIVPPSSAETVM